MEGEWCVATDRKPVHEDRRLARDGRSSRLNRQGMPGQAPLLPPLIAADDIRGVRGSGGRLLHGIKSLTLTVMGHGVHPGERASTL